MRYTFLLPLLCIVSLLAVAGAQTAVISAPSKAYANQTINQAAAAIEIVNESAYLIFYPNLTQAYADLSNAQSAYNTSTASVIFYASKAMQEANLQYQQLNTYRNVSIAVMLFFSLVFALLIIRVVRPVEQKRRGRKARRA